MTFLRNRKLEISLRIIVAATFLFSAISKLPSITFFELDLISNGIASWTVAPFLSRLIIAVEFCCGVFLLFNYLSRQVILPTIIFMLIAFTIFLSITIINNGNSEDCGCFGGWIKMNPLEAIIKNVLLLFASLYLLKTVKKTTWKFKWIMPTTVVIAIAAVFIIQPVPSFLPEDVPGPNSTSINLQPLHNYKGSTIEDMLSGKSGIAFLSPTCSHCKEMAYKLKILRKEDKELKFFLVFLGRKKDIETFIEEQELDIPYVILQATDFFTIAGFTVPRLALARDGKKEYEFDNKNFDPLFIREYLKDYHK